MPLSEIVASKLLPCPKCGSLVWLARIMPDEPECDQHTFECEDCGHQVTRIFEQSVPQPTTAAGSGGLSRQQSSIGRARLMSYNEQTSQNALANAKLLFKALAAREANLDEPIPIIGITDVAVQIGLEGDEFDSALDYAADQGWFEDAEVADSASWVSLTPAGVAVAKS